MQKKTFSNIQVMATQKISFTLECKNGGVDFDLKSASCLVESKD